MVSILVDDTLQLRTYLPEDTAELFHVVNQSRQHLRAFLSWVDTAIRPEHTANFIQQSLADQNDQRALALGIFHHGRIVGSIGLHNWNHYLKKAEIGYWIAKDSEGQGIVTRAAERFIDFIFGKLGMNKVEIHFMPHNTQSAAVAARLGARVEGVIRQSHMFNGKTEDIVITGILRSEWPQCKK